MDKSKHSLTHFHLPPFWIMILSSLLPEESESGDKSHAKLSRKLAVRFRFIGELGAKYSQIEWVNDATHSYRVFETFHHFYEDDGEVFSFSHTMVLFPINAEIFKIIIKLKPYFENYF